MRHSSTYILHVACCLILLLITKTVAIISEEESLLHSVCNGNDILVNGIAATCTHGKYTYVSGAFTRIQGRVNQSFNFGRYDDKNHWEALPSLGLGLVNDLDSMVDLKSEDERKILAYAKAMECPKERDYIIIGGHFAFVQNSSTSKLFNQTYVNVSNIVLFDVRRKIYVPVKTQAPIDQSGSYNETLRRNMSEYGVSVSSSKSLAVISSLSCMDDRYCSRVYMGGLFDYAFGVRAGNIVGFSITYPNRSKTYPHALVQNITVVGRSAHVGVDGIVMAVQTLSENRVVFGGAFPSIAGDFSASLGVWNGLNSTENDTFTNYGCVPTMGKRIAEQGGVECVVPAVCCHGIGGFVFALERISKNAVMVGGEFEMSFSHAHAKNLVQIVYDSAIPTSTSAWIFPNASETDVVSIQASGPVNSLHCASRNSDGTCLEMYVGGQFQRLQSISPSGHKGPEIATDLALAVLKANESSLRSLSSSQVSYQVFGIPVLPHPFNFTVLGNNETIQSITSTQHDDGSISMIVGGVVNDTNDIFSLRRTWSSNNRLILENTSALIPSNENNYGVLELCPLGSFCPSNGVQVKCPDDWGIYCPGTNSLGNRNICPAGFYCPDPSTMKICPSRHYCREGSMTPNPCFIFEVCPTGSSKPDGSMYGVFITIVLFVVIYSSRTCYFRVRNKKRKKRSQKKNALTSSLEYLVPRWRRDTTLSDVMAFVGLERDVEDSGMRSSNSSASLISTGSARTNTSDVHVMISPKNKEEKEDEPPFRRIKRIESYGDLIETKEITAAVRFQNVCVTLDRPTTLQSCTASVSKMLSRCCSKIKKEKGDNETALLQNHSDSITKKKKKKKMILKNVSGNLRPYRLCGVMGPSGCGKTTLLSAIANRLHAPARMSGGDIYLNNERCNTKEGGLPLDVLGFVPQEDIMLRELTVRQILWFSLLLKGNPKRTYEEREDFINNILIALDIFKVRHTIVGDENQRGVSGGQRKRVNIGIELVSEPLVLLLDEPTSGLDSTASADLISNLKSFAKKGLTICMVIHQPRAEILDMIDDIIVLREGGRTVYKGPTSQALNFFETFGYRRPNRTSPADFILDVTTQMKHLPQSWKKYRSKEIREQRRRRRNDGGDGVVIVESKNSNDEEEEQEDAGYISTDEEDWWPDKDDVPMSKIPPRSCPALYTQYFAIVRRGLIQHAWRRPWVLLTDATNLVVAGGLLGAVFSSQEAQDITMRYLLAGLALGLTGMSMSMRVFGNERVQFWRESSAGVSVTAYFFGKITAFLVPMFAAPAFFLIFFYNMTNPRFGFFTYYFIFLMTNYTVTTMGYLVSIVFEPRSALIVSVIVNVLALMFAGVNPNVQTMGSSTFGAVGMDLSYARWAVEMQFLQELRNYPSAAYKLGVIQNWLSNMGYYEAGKKSTANELYETTPFDKTWYKVEFAVCVGHLILIGIGCTLLSYILIIRQARNNIV